MQKKSRLFILLVAVLSFSSQTLMAQTTAFTYQGKLADNNLPAAGNYDFEFKLFDTAAVGTGAQQGATLQRLGVAVSGGIFFVSLDFGVCASCFNGSPRFLEIAVKLTSGSTFTTLGPRQPVTSTPYAIKSGNAASADGLSVACVSCVTSSQIQSVSGSAVTGAIPVLSLPAGSDNYIQNSNSQQTGSNFNISGNGTAGGTLSGNIVNAATQFNLAGLRMLSASGAYSDGFFIAAASNTFMGEGAGFNTIPDPIPTSFTGKFNTFFGSNSGKSNTAGATNSFFGAGAGLNNTTGGGNSIFGGFAGNNISGNFNTIMGYLAGLSNFTGSFNTVLGANADVFSGLTNATAIGARAFVTQSNSLVLGSINGINQATADTKVGIGTTAPTERLHVEGNGLFTGTGTANILNATTQFNLGGSRVLSIAGANNLFVGISNGSSNTTGGNNSFFGPGAGFSNTTGNNNAFFGNSAGFSNTTASSNSFFGLLAGLSNTIGANNAFFGTSSGQDNVDGMDNSFFGVNTGRLNISGNHNSYFGRLAGRDTTTGSDNTMVGFRAGFDNSTGSNLTIIGADADVGANNLTNATAIGAGAVVSSNNTIALGRTSGADTVRVYGNLIINTLGGATATMLCINTTTSIVSSCSSSLRYKSNVLSLKSGLNLVNRLRPVTFDWRETGARDLGLIAEEVEAVDPLLVTRNKEGEIQGVKYDRISIVLVNAVKEQQTQIEVLERQNLSQQKQLEEQKTLINQQQERLDKQAQEFAALKKLVCSMNPTASICQSRD